MKVLTKYKGVHVRVRACVCVRAHLCVLSHAYFPPARLNAPSSPTENGGVLKSSIGKIAVSSPADLINGKILVWSKALCVCVCASVCLYRSR